MTTTTTTTPDTTVHDQIVAEGTVRTFSFAGIKKNLYSL